MAKRVLLIILDGWGIAQDKERSAIDKANTPVMGQLLSMYPNSTLNTSGLSVGLPEGQMGNSEVGHMNIGAGRIVYQDLVKINRAIEDQSITQNDMLNRAINQALEPGKSLHLIGLVSDGGVHSHINHLKGLVKCASDKGVRKLFVHAFTDGRDTDPKSGYGFVRDLEQYLSAHRGTVASVVGRYYSMDRDKRWQRTKLAYDLLVDGIGEPTENLLESIEESYRQGITDEFLKPMIKVDPTGSPIASIKEGDVVISFNFRNDRARQITKALTQNDMPEHHMNTIPLFFYTMTNYDDTFNNLGVLFEKDHLNNTLGELISRAGKKQIRIAETEKYPHVTYFFSGGREVEFEGEKRILCPSPKVATYDLQPEMSAPEVTQAIIPEIKSQTADFICLNFANPDMVGHTGVFDAAVKACETVDACTGEVVKAALEMDYTTIIIADHGNSDIMLNEDGSPNTAHTTNPVPFILVSNYFKGTVKSGKLGDLAPTILKLMDMEVPADMTGDILINENA